MKIGILGAPGSGKSEVASRIARNLNREHNGRWRVIDGYVQRLGDRTGRDYGRDADYPHNVQIMAERWTLEAEALHQGYSTITCGTMIETLIYSALIDLTTLHDPDRLHYAQTSMGFLGYMEDQTFNYNALFWLPFDEPTASEQHSWEAVVNAKIPDVAEARFRFLNVLEGTTRQKVTYALEVIRNIRDSYDATQASASDDEPPV
jgi:hypothetical protein